MPRETEGGDPTHLLVDLFGPKLYMLLELARAMAQKRPRDTTHDPTQIDSGSDTPSPNVEEERNVAPDLVKIVEILAETCLMNREQISDLRKMGRTLLDSSPYTLHQEHYRNRLRLMEDEDQIWAWRMDLFFQAFSPEHDPAIRARSMEVRMVARKEALPSDEEEEEENLPAMLRCWPEDMFANHGAGTREDTGTDHQPAEGQGEE